MKLKVTIKFRDFENFMEIKTKMTHKCFFRDFEYLSFYFIINKKTKIIELYDYAIKILNNLNKEFKEKYVIFSETGNPQAFFIENKNKTKSVFIENTNKELKKILNYLKIKKHIILFNFLPALGATWKNKYGVKYFTHSNEENHKYLPHIHTNYNGIKASYKIYNAEKLIGEKYPKKIEKSIVREILNNREKLLKYWQDTTNGILCVNPPLGIIKQEKD